jgi:hypothetical protein
MNTLNKRTEQKGDVDVFAMSHKLVDIKSGPCQSRFRLQVRLLQLQVWNLHTLLSLSPG